MKWVLGLLLLCGLEAGAQVCSISNALPIPVVPGGMATITTSNCPSPSFSVACTGAGCVAGSINSSTGVYTAPATFRPYNYSRGIQLVPNNSIYNYPIGGLSVDPRSTLWLNAVAFIRPDLVKPDHNFKLGTAPVGSLDFFNNTVNAATPTQPWHSLNVGNIGPYQDAVLPILQPPDILMQAGWSVDVQGCQSGCASPDRHIFEANRDTVTETEIYQEVYDFHNFVWTRGNPTLVSFTSNTVRPMQTPIRVFIRGAGTTCSGINYVNTNAQTFFATVTSPGHLSIPFNSASCAAADLNSATISSTTGLCPSCNTAGAMNWPGNSNAIVGGVDAAGSIITGTSLDMEQWWKNVQLGITDPNCGGCITAAQHVIRTTLTNQAISPRNLAPAVLGAGVTGNHPNMPLLSCTQANPVVCTISSTGCGGTSCLSNQIPCIHSSVRAACVAGDTVVNVNSHLTGAWTALNGQFTATVIDLTHFSYPVDSTTFGAFPAGATFIFDWMPYGTRMRLKSTFNVAGFCAPTVLTDKCPYEKALLYQLQTYGLILMDGTSQGDNWDSGVINSWFQPDQLLDAMTDVRNLCSNTQAGCLLGSSWESNLEVVDESAIQTFAGSQVYTNPANQLQTTSNQRIIVTVTSANGNATVDVNPIGTSIGIDPERIAIAASPTTPPFQPAVWVTGNTNTAYGCTMSPAVTGASVSSSGRVTPPNSIAALTKTTVICVSSADAQAVAYMEVIFVPVSSDGKIRLAFGQHATSYTDTGGKVWWGQLVPRAFNSTYEVADGIVSATLNGTWTNNSANWSGTTDAQLYAQSTSNQNDTNLRIVIPNGSYTLTLYGEAGYGINASGQNVFDVEVNGNVAASYQDGYINAAGIYKPYTQNYNVTVSSNGVLNFNGRQREVDPGGHGMSMSSLLLTPGGLPLSITTASLPPGSLTVFYDQFMGATGGSPPYTWSISAGTLPTGLSLNATTGEIAGTPSGSIGTSSFTVQVCDTIPHCATQPLSIVINNAPVMITTLPPLPNGTVGTAYSQTMAATGGATPYVWSIVFGGIPGVTINSSTGVLSGTPTTPGLFAMSIRVTDANSTQNTRAFPTTVINPSPITTRSQVVGTSTIVGSSTAR